MDVSSIKLTLNGTAVTPQEVTRNGAFVYVAYTPDPARTNPENAFTLEFKDTNGLTTQASRAP